MRKSAYLSDLAFAFCAAFLPALCFLRFKRIPLLWSAALAGLFGAGITLAVAATMKKRNCARTLKAKDQRETEKLALHLAMLSPTKQTDFFAERAKAVLSEPLKREGQPLPYESAVDTQQDGNIDQRSRRFLETENFVGYCRFRAAPLSADDTLPIVAHSTDKIPVLLCNALTEDGKSLLNRFGIRAVTIEEIYLKLKTAELLPTEYKSEAAFAKRKIRIFSGFTKQNARPFFTGGALILISSLFSPFPYYYLVFGIGLMAAAALIKILAR